MQTKIQGLLPVDLCLRDSTCINPQCNKQHPKWDFNYCVPFLKEYGHESSSCESNHITWEEIRSRVESTTAKTNPSSTYSSEVGLNP